MPEVQPRGVAGEAMAQSSSVGEVPEGASWVLGEDGLQHWDLLVIPDAGNMLPETC